ncbi:MAG: DUF1592 domain-containing protein [Verrucomicrobia bacterium]|nr:DUF1592 domain-containing protein [Verrucomicrobiota bacterium]
MPKRLSILLLVAAVLSLGLGAAKPLTSASPRVDRRAAEAQLNETVMPVLREYCWDCHGDTESKGGVNFDAHTNLMAVLRDRGTWERVIQTVRSGEMPPKKRKAQPDTEVRTHLVGWIERTLFPIDPSRPDPGRVTLRRLNRVEYNNTVRDLFGVDFQPADDFPQDDVGYGFDNIGDVLSMPPILLEKYLNAAEEILDRAIVTGPLTPKARRFTPSQIQGHVGSGALATLSAQGEMFVDYEAPVPGDYVFKVQAYGDQAGDQKVQMALRADGRDLETIEVRRSRGNPKLHEHRLVLQPGKHRLSAAFLNDFYRQTELLKTNSQGKTYTEKKIEDRNLQVEFIEVTGPFSEAVPPLHAMHRKVFFKAPGPQTTNQVAREILRRVTDRAYRRSATTAELDGLMRLFGQARESGDGFEASVKQALMAVLVSPHFLFRGEIQSNPDNPHETHRVSEYALASRLSYFLWSTMPDDELFRLAGQGRLRRNLAGQVKRMLVDPKSRALVDNFAGQWLQLRTLDIVSPDEKLFPGFDASLRSALRQETESLFEHVLRKDRPITEFLTADYTFVNEPLARHYGIAGVHGPDFVRVSLKGTGRSGVLTHGSVLTLTSNPNRTSPVKRGKWILENILASPPPPPPPGVPALESKETHGTLRQRMDAHRDNAMCASCHAKMDPLGFAFEHFDAVGRFREKDGDEVVDTRGELVSGERFADHVELSRVLSDSRQADFVRCVSEKMLTYALGRGLEYYDRPALAAMNVQLMKKGLRFSALIQAVVDSVPFQYRRGDGDPLLVENPSP